MLSLRLSAFLSKTSERNYATVIASIASIAVASTFIWTTFFIQHEEATAVKTSPITVAITEKPSLKQPSHSQQTTNIRTQKTKQQHASTIKQTVIPTKKNQLTIGKGKLFVQTGAFKEIINARVSYEKMRREYKRARIMPKKGYYAIWVGPVSTRAEAETLQKHILQHDKIKGFITSE